MLQAHEKPGQRQHIVHTHSELAIALSMEISDGIDPVAELLSSASDPDEDDIEAALAAIEESEPCTSRFQHLNASTNTSGIGRSGALAHTS